MSDLISRSALIEAITQHSKDVKSDVSMVQDIYQIAHQHIIQLIEIQPTVYDIEKIVEELERKKRTSVECLGERNGTGFNKVMDLAINIVKRGGVE